jgi:hypothetical protein
MEVSLYLTSRSDEIAKIVAISSWLDAGARHRSQFKALNADIKKNLNS